MKKNLLLAAVFGLLTTTLSCGDDDGGTPAIAEPTVYIVGTELLEDGTTDIHYYVGDQMTTIPGNGNFMISIGITADGSDVYVSGNIRDNVGNSAAYWKNGVLNPLNNAGGFDSSTAGHEFWDGDIYVYGSVQRPTGEQAVYWKNGQEVILESQYSRTRATGMALVNGKVMVAGWAAISGVGSIPLVWEDGVVRQLPAGNTRGVRPLEMEEHQGDFYVYGFASGRDRQPVLCIWKNGVLTEIRSEMQIQNVPDIEVSGYNANLYYLWEVITATGRRVMYNKDGADIVLIDDTTELVFMTDIEVHNDVVYVAGNVQTPTNNGFNVSPLLWFNDEEQLDYAWPEFFQIFDMYVR